MVWIHFSLGISTVDRSNLLAELSVKVQGEDSEAILQEFVNEYERNQNAIYPAMIKNTIKRNNWLIVEYSDNAELGVCQSGFRVHITMRKTPQNKDGLEVL